MAELSLIRIDSRLIHGQVCTAWLTATSASRIIVIDDVTAKDPFLSQILLLASPKGIQVELMTAQQASDAWEKNQFGEGKVLVLFKSVDIAHQAYFAGFQFETLQIGGVGGGKGKVTVVGAISLNETEMKQLKMIAEAGCKVYFQILPHDAKIDFERVQKKFFPKLN